MYDVKKCKNCVLNYFFQDKFECKSGYNNFLRVIDQSLIERHEVRHIFYKNWADTRPYPNRARTWSETRTRTQSLGALVRLILISESFCMNLKIFSLEMSTSQLQKFDVLLAELIWVMKYQTIGFLISC